nr:MAG TPA_asm: hypothetical protein [Caudoviricetes sp.]
MVGGFFHFANVMEITNKTNITTQIKSTTPHFSFS